MYQYMKISMSDVTHTNMGRNTKYPEIIGVDKSVFSKYEEGLTIKIKILELDFKKYVQYKMFAEDEDTILLEMTN